MKKKLAATLSVVLILGMAVLGILAYLSDTDSDVNVMTLGEVSITQNEQQRVEKDGQFTSELEDFEQEKILMPVTYPDGRSADKVTIGEHEVVLSDDKANYVDKIISVTNDGESEAYVRTLVAVPTGGEDWEPTPVSANNCWLHWNIPSGYSEHWKLSDTVTFVEIDGIGYYVWEFVHEKALASGETTYPMVRGFYMDQKVDNDDNGFYMTYADGTTKRIDDFTAEDTVDILVVSQAVQTEGFADAQTALDTAFGDITEKNHPWMQINTWNGKADTSWYDAAASVYTLDSAEDVAGLAELVNAGNSFKGKTVKLSANIDLGDKKWTPIGNSSNKFQGTFDGDNHVVYNLNVSMEGKSDVGFFGFTTGGEIKNLTINDANVKGRLNVGVVAGTPYTSKYTNITVTGTVKVDGMSYVGGVLGKNAYANITDITVNVTDDSYVKANSVENGTAYRTYVGGVIGFMGEGGHKVTNVTSNIDVIGSTCDVGGIAGIAHYGNSFINCSSSGNVTITDASEAADAEEMGGIAGVWHNGGSDVTFEGCSFTGKLTANITEGLDLSDNTIVGAAYSATGTGTLIIK